MNFEADDFDWALGELLALIWRGKVTGTPAHLLEPRLFHDCMYVIIAGWHCRTPEMMETSDAIQKSGKLALVDSCRRSTPKHWHCRSRGRQSARSEAEPRSLGERLHGREAQAVVAGGSRAAGEGS